MKQLFVAIILLTTLQSFAQKKEFYRFSYSYFVTQVSSPKDGLKYYLLQDKWVKVTSNDIKNYDVEQSTDWKIVDQTGGSIQGDFTKKGVYYQTNDHAYNALMNKWKHLYFKPLWEIKMRELGYGFDYSLTAYDTSAPNKVQMELDVHAFDYSEVHPEFIGGKEKLNDYLAENTHYPQKAINMGVSGTVYLKFMIQKNGEIGEVITLRGIHPLLDKEAARVIRNMPNWIPGRQNGKRVNVWYVLPIKFKIN